MKTVVKKPAAKKRRKKAVKEKPEKDVAASFNQFKEFGGKQYTGMKVGRSHKWYYDQGEWKETKITPDLWSISYAVTKRRAGKAPEGSGAAVGTGYHWYILAHQNVTKLNEDDYSTSMTGLKYKLAHKRADKEKWSATAVTQRKHLVQFLKTMLAQLEKDPVPLEFEYKDKVYSGEAIPIPGTEHGDVHHDLEITLNNENMGIIRRMTSSWKMELVKDQGLVNAIGNELMLWYEQPL